MKRYYSFIILLFLSLISQSCSTLDLKSRLTPDKAQAMPDFQNQSSFSDKDAIVKTEIIFLALLFIFLMFLLIKHFYSKRSSSKSIDLDSVDISLLELTFGTLNDFLIRIKKKRNANIIPFQRS